MRWEDRRSPHFRLLPFASCLLPFLAVLALAQPGLPDDKGVVAEAQKKLAADPKNPALFLALGNAQAGLQRMNEAIATFTKGLEVEPESVPLLLNRGHRYLNNR